MRREEWLDREIRTMVQGVHQVFGVSNSDEEPVSPLTISGDPPPDEEETADPTPPLVDDAEMEAADADAPASVIPPPAPGTGARRAARHKHKRDKR